ncbi:MAG: hypothetical protein Q4A61_00750 [Porphyromonadaceae bacterium]|nr:hypothetical protein [Porphyromonadaceae bacterium]
MANYLKQTTSPTQRLRSIGAERAAREAPKRIVRQHIDIDVQAELETIVQIARGICPNFVIDEANRFAITQALRWLFGQPFKALDPKTRKWTDGDPHKGLYIEGKTGTGKSVLLRLLNLLAMHLGANYYYGTPDHSGGYVYHALADKLHPDNRDVEWEGAGKTALLCLCSDITDAFTHGARLEEYKRVGVLMLQDLGAEPLQSLYMGNRMGVLEQILCARGDEEGLMTLLTSNIRLYIPPEAKRTGHGEPMSDVADLYGERVQDRLFAMCNLIPIPGESRRGAPPPPQGEKISSNGAKNQFQ